MACSVVLEHSQQGVDGIRKAVADTGRWLSFESHGPPGDLTGAGSRRCCYRECARPPLRTPMPALAHACELAVVGHA
eukprot:9457057-Alexandrium_andersonii.AAC.1